ncbi:MAG: hypothetical protein ABIJ16_11745 [Bacteroidota bacterium]
MKKILVLFSFFIFTMGCFITNPARGQADEILQLCTQYLIPPFVSDGQQYKALLTGDELAEFHATFYGGSTYRVIACSGLSEGNLLFSLYDKERNLLFTNKNYENSPYWDFKFTSTIDCIIEAELDTKSSNSGFAILMIGFKQK